MGAVITIIIGVIILFAVLGLMSSPSGKKEEGAKIGAAAGGLFILNALPTIIVIVLIVFIVRACS